MWRLEGGYNREKKKGYKEWEEPLEQKQGISFFKPGIINIKF